jgi:transcriptional regulator with XRE-family HTH domain
MNNLKEEDVLKVIGIKVNELRKLKASNYESFCSKHGINKVTYLSIEHGNNFNMKSFIQVLDALNISFNEFFKKWDEDVFNYMFNE